jgi:hypothetical protein
LSNTYFVVNSEERVARFSKRIAELFADKKYIRFSWSFEKRSLDQNALLNIWYREIGNELGEEAIDVRARCKLDYGVPIRRREEKFNKVWKALEQRVFNAYKSTPREVALAFIREFAITSEMDTQQMTEYMQTIKRVHSVQGVTLSRAEDFD